MKVGWMTTLAAVLVAGRAASAQVYSQIGSDIRPANAGGTVATSAVDDPTGAFLPTVRAFGYSLNVVPGDPYFAQSPGINAVSGSGLPSRSVLSFSPLTSLSYWSGNGPVRSAAPPALESLRLNFGINNATISGRAYSSGFNIGQVSTTGALHRHLNAFLQSADGNSVAGDGNEPTPGAYFFQMRINVTGLTSSSPLIVGFNNGLTPATFDRWIFWARNTYAPGTGLAGVQSSLVGLSAQAGETSLGIATRGGQTSKTKYISPSAKPLVFSTPVAKGSVTFAPIASNITTDVVLWLSGTTSNIATLIAALDQPNAGYDIAPAGAAPTDRLYSTLATLSGQFSGFSAVLRFDSGFNTAALSNGAFTWNFLDSAGIAVSAVAVLPDPRGQIRSVFGSGLDGIGIGTGFAATLSPAVPEPTAMVAWFVGVGAAVGRRRRG